MQASSKTETILATVKFPRSSAYDRVIAFRSRQPRRSYPFQTALTFATKGAEQSGARTIRQSSIRSIENAESIKGRIVNDTKVQTVLIRAGIRATRTKPRRRDVNGDTWIKNFGIPSIRDTRNR